jgi:hypothetical protein
MTEQRPIYCLRLRPEPGVDAVRALRAALKILLRRFGLQAVSLEEEKNNAEVSCERTEERQTRNTEHFSAVLELIVNAGKGESDV